MTKESYITSALLTARNSDMYEKCDKETAFKLGIEWGWNNGESNGIRFTAEKYELKLNHKDKRIAKLEKQIAELNEQLGYLKAVTDTRLPSNKQLNFIDIICNVLELPKPRCLNMTEAKNWISEHIDDYYQQIEYIKEFEGYDWSDPNGE